MAQWLWCWTCDWRSRVQSQPLHCRVRSPGQVVHRHTLPLSRSWFQLSIEVNRHTVQLTRHCSRVKYMQCRTYPSGLAAWLMATEISDAALCANSGSGRVLLFYFTSITCFKRLHLFSILFVYANAKRKGRTRCWLNEKSYRMRESRWACCFLT